MEVRDRVRLALGQLPPRERKILNLYYFGEITMKQIGDAIGVNESRVSQLHARAIDRLRKLMELKEQVPSRPTLVKKPAARPKVVRPVRHDVEHRRVA
jgi:RNA polymerase sigma factor for flagellar operon FliA